MHDAINPYQQHNTNTHADTDIYNLLSTLCMLLPTLYALCLHIGNATVIACGWMQNSVEQKIQIFNQ